MKRRLSRAKAKIKATGIPFAVPAEHLLPDRLDAVLAVIYLIYNEGYSGRVDLGRRGDPAGPSARRADARRAGGARAAGADDDPPRPARGAVLRRRSGAARGPGPVAVGHGADRAPGRAVLERAIALRGRGPYVLQAAIASLQTEERIDWHEVAELYGAARRRSPARRWSSSTARSRSPRPGRPSRRSRSSTASTWTTTSTCTRPAASCCAGSAGPMRRAKRSSARSSSHARRPSGASSSDGSPSCRPLRRNSRPTHCGCPLGARPFVVSA